MIVLSTWNNWRKLPCSELVAESYQRIGHLAEPPKGWPSNEYTPRYFSTEARYPVHLHKGFTLSDEIKIKRQLLPPQE